MKQQYTILKDHDKSRLIIREFGELDKDSLSLLCEESYDDAVVSRSRCHWQRKSHFSS